ncbi:hypothetical protein [Streptomyces fradiae]|uniref:hypothetical protein n=1 Tax=Streptomyces fradiae TaxID=1906 RepID=UPI002019C739|nr:hypothetical protein [Streptomyces fradiae]
MEHASVVTGVPGAQSTWETAYKWLRLAQGLRTVTFDMSYDDSGMCSAGLDFDAVWTEMMEEWQQHQVRLGYLRAALEGFVRLLHPDATEPGAAVEAAERRLHHYFEGDPHGTAAGLAGGGLREEVCEVDVTVSGGLLQDRHVRDTMNGDRYRQLFLSLRLVNTAVDGVVGRRDVA